MFIAEAGSRERKEMCRYMARTGKAVTRERKERLKISTKLF